MKWAREWHWLARRRCLRESPLRHADARLLGSERPYAQLLHFRR